MSMTTGDTGSAMSDMNVTPLIDVLLVLLIIFMVIVPVTPKGLNALVPQPPKNKQQQPDQRTIVVQVLGGANGPPTYKINEDTVAFTDLLTRLTSIFATRAEPERVMFIKGDANLNFASIAQVLDIGTSAGAQHVGLITPKIEAGQ